MKNKHEEEVDRLIEGHIKCLYGVNRHLAIKCALNDVENTIKVLDKMNRKHLGRNIEIQINFDFQTKVRDILKNKLK